MSDTLTPDTARDADEPAFDWTAPNRYPRLYNISAGFIFNGMVRPEMPQLPEYVTVRMPRRDHTLHVAVSQWNMLWEAAQFRRRFFDDDDLVEPLRTIAELGDVNVSLVPRTRSRYHEYSPLFHLLPKRTLDRFGLPMLPAGQWPFLAALDDPDTLLPRDFQQRLADAWAATIWRHLVSGSPQSAFRTDDSLRVLAHNLDFWLPAVTGVIQQRLRELPEVDKGVEAGPVKLIDGSILEGAVVGNPRMGSEVWMGEEDAAVAVEEVVEAADASGRLREIVDAIRSNRVEDDFSDHWSYAREDFERKLHRKRSKVKVSFVELDECPPVQSPETEVLDGIVYGDFLTLLDEREHQIVVLLHSGMTKLTDIASELGYANHSPVSKRLDRIRTKAAQHFDRN